MAGFNGSGTFSRVYSSWVADRIAGTPITDTRMDDEFSGFVTGLTTTICRDGQSTTTARIPFAAGVNVMTGAAAAVGLSITGDVGTGLWSSGATTNLSIAVAGTTRLSAGTAGVAVTGTLSSSGVFTGTTTAVFGANSGTGGAVKLYGATSGDATIKVAAAAGTSTIFQVPASNGTSGYVLTTDGSGVTSWLNPASIAGDLDVGTTAIVGGTTTRILYNNAGVLGEYTLSGTGTIVAMTAGPTFTGTIAGAALTLSTPLGAASGGTGVANNAASTLTISGNFATTLTVSATTGVTLPTTGTLATLAGTETFTNKTLTTAVLNGTVTGTSQATANTASTLVMRDASGNFSAGTITTSTLAATTINAFTLGGTVSGGGNQINNVIIGTSTPLAGSFTTLSATGTLSMASGGIINFGSGNYTLQHSNLLLSTSGAVTVGGLLTVTTSNSSRAVHITGATTGYFYTEYSNSGGTSRHGVESSAGNALLPGGLAYATVFGSLSNTALQFFTNNLSRVVIAAGGEASFASSTTASSTSAAALVVTGGVGIGDNLRVANGLTTGGALGAGGAIMSNVGAALYGADRPLVTDDTASAIIRCTTTTADNVGSSLGFAVTGGAMIAVIKSYREAGTTNGGGLIFATRTDAAFATERMRISYLGVLSLSNTTEASNLTTASVVLSGGLSVAKKIFVGDHVDLQNGKLAVWRAPDGSANPTYNFATGQSTYLSLITTFNGATVTTLTNVGDLTLAASTTASSTAAAALVVTGGVGIGDNLRVANKIYVAQLILTENQLNQTTTNGAAEVAVNYKGYNDGTTQFRNFQVYNGKQASLLLLTGSSGGLQVPGVYSNTSAEAANVYVNSAGDILRSTSSLLYKQNVRTYPRGLDDVMRLRPVLFEAKGKAGKDFAGFISEEVEAAGLNEFVDYRDGKPDALHYGHMTALLASAVKQIAVEFAIAKTRIEQLEKRNNHV